MVVLSRPRRGRKLCTTCSPTTFLQVGYASGSDYISHWSVENPVRTLTPHAYHLKSEEVEEVFARLSRFRDSCRRQWSSSFKVLDAPMEEFEFISLIFTVHSWKWYYSPNPNVILCAECLPHLSCADYNATLESPQILITCHCMSGNRYYTFVRHLFVL
ncbi:hypothetical protein AVEN_217316-1 [Araneus ventricosus]|uniref:Uncharacterized protein n=1 Tax=Araneus ventricosus TaxID=182803 RepID=A0A4Y2V6A4_ARAVE|nr:hypothetical protein AVEN_217316-1 [Araneus ventricosus]